MTAARDRLTRRLLVLLVLGALCASAGRIDFLIQGALDSEIQPLIAALDGRREVRLGIWTFWTGRIGRSLVAISRTDMGPINAVGATMEGIRRFRPKAIINQGTAGAHNPELKLWDIVVGEKTVDYSALRSSHGDPGTGIRPERWSRMPHKFRTPGGDLREYAVFEGAPRLVESAARAPYARGRVIRGVVGSAFQFNRELDYIAEIRRIYATDSEDMESAYVAGAALAAGVPFVAVRIISDSEWNHPTFERIAGQYCAEFVRDWIRKGVEP